MINGNIRNRLTFEDHRVNCQAAEIMKASHLALTIGQLNYVIDSRKTITGEVNRKVSCFQPQVL